MPIPKTRASYSPSASATPRTCERKLRLLERQGPKELLECASLAYNTRHQHEVAQVLDGHLWEVAWADSWNFNPDGSLIID